MIRSTTSSEGVGVGEQRGYGWKERVERRAALGCQLRMHVTVMLHGGGLLRTPDATQLGSFELTNKISTYCLVLIYLQILLLGLDPFVLRLCRFCGLSLYFLAHFFVLFSHHLGPARCLVT